MPIVKKRLAGETEAYLLTFEEPHTEAAEIGTMTRVGWNEWKFTLADSEYVQQPAGGAPPIEAETIDDAIEWLNCHMQAIKIPKNVLDDKMFSNFACGQMHGLNILATRANATAGFTSAMIQIAAKHIAEDYDDKATETLEMFIVQLRAAVKTEQEREAALRNIREAGLPGIFQGILGGILKTAIDASKAEKGAKSDEPDADA